MQGTHVGFFEDIKDFKCKYCDEHFDTHPLLNKHLRKSGDEYSCKGKTHLCHHCDKKFGNIKLLKNHLLAIKTEMMCDDCGKVFHSSTQLINHKKSHSGNFYFLPNNIYYN